MRNLSLILTLFLTCLGTAPALAQGKGDDKRAAIRKLLDLTGAGQLGVQVLQQMMTSLRASMPKVPDQFWQDFMKEVNPDELIELVVPIYDRHLTLAEVKQVIRFYETPAGRKLITVLPVITQESMEAGRRWGQMLNERVAQRLREQGPRQSQAPPPPK